MFKSILFLFAFLSFSLFAHADVPKCWDSKEIAPGQYSVEINTAGTSAEDVAAILFRLQGPAFSKSVSTRGDLKTIYVALSLPLDPSGKILDFIKSEALYELANIAGL